MRNFAPHLVAVGQHEHVPLSQLAVADRLAAELRAVVHGDLQHTVPALQGQPLADVDLVIEAVFEDPDLKKQIFAKLDKTCKPGAILATNTSYQDVNEIGDATNRPEDVIGLHFFSPAHIMKLLEVVRAEKTAADVLATCMALAKKIRKTPVVSGVCYGFIGNRMLGHYAREAQLCVIEGATPEQVDAAMEEWGMAMGPLAVFDLAGLDVGYKARQGLPEEERGDPRAFRVADALVEMNRLGQKTGAGFYRYDAETRQRSSDPEVEALIERDVMALPSFTNSGGPYPGTGGLLPTIRGSAVFPTPQRASG